MSEKIGWFALCWKKCLKGMDKFFSIANLILIKGRSKMGKGMVLVNNILVKVFTLREILLMESLMENVKSSLKMVPNSLDKLLMEDYKELSLPNMEALLKATLTFKVYQAQIVPRDILMEMYTKG